MAIEYKYTYMAKGAIALLLLIIPFGIAFAQIPNNAVDEIIEPFVDLADSTDDIRDLATSLFWALITIEFVITAISLFWAGSDFNAFGRFLVERMVVIGIAIYMFQSGPWIAWMLQWVFSFVGLAAGGIEPNPTEVIETGIKLGTELSNSVGFWDGAASIPILIAALLLSILFALIASNMTLVLIELYILTTVGAFLLGFAGSSWTRDYAIGYFRYVIAVSFKLVVMQVLVGVGLTVITGWIGTITGAGIKNTGMLTLISTMIVFYSLTNTLPAAAAGLVSGTTTGGFGEASSGISQFNNSMKAAANTVKGAVGAIASAGNAAKNFGQAANSAAKVSKNSGASGTAAVVSGATGNMAKALGQEIDKSSRGINGPLAQRQSYTQRVNRNLTKQANAGGKS